MGQMSGYYDHMLVSNGPAESAHVVHVLLTIAVPVSKTGVSRRATELNRLGSRVQNTELHMHAAVKCTSAEVCTPLVCTLMHNAGWDRIADAGCERLALCERVTLIHTRTQVTRRSDTALRHCLSHVNTPLELLGGDMLHEHPVPLVTQNQRDF
jgi:hypothetical protein